MSAEQQNQIELERLKIEIRRLELEENLFKRHFGAICTVIATLIVAIVGNMGISTYRESIQIDVANRELTAYLIYVKSVQETWTGFKANGTVNNKVEKLGIDAYEDLRVLASPEFLATVNTVNTLFGSLKKGFVITPEVNSDYNDAINRMNHQARLEFKVLR